jgi:hypothetical protein
MDEFIEALDTELEVTPETGFLDYIPGGVCADLLTSTFFFLAAMPFQGELFPGAPELHHIWHLFAGKAVVYGSSGLLRLEDRMKREGKLTEQDEINLNLFRP